MKQAARLIHSVPPTSTTYQSHAPTVPDKEKHMAPNQTALMAAVLESSRLVCSSLDHDEVLRRILRAARDLSGAESVTVMLLDETNAWLILSAAVGVTHNTQGELRLRVGEGLAGWVAQTGQPLHLSNPAADPRYHDFPPSQISNILALPLRVRDHVLGVLNLSQQHTTALFSDTVVQMIEVFAGYAAIAIDNAATATKLRHAANRERLLNTINQAMLDMNSPDKVIDLALEGLGTTLDVSCCVLYCYQTDTNPVSLRLTNEWISPDHVYAERNQVSAPPVDAATHTDTCHVQSNGAVVNTLLCHHDRRVGWLQVSACIDTRHWRDEELDLIRTVGDQLALTLVQNELATQEQRSRDLSDTLSQLAAACTAIIDQQAVLNFILEQLARFVRYDAAAVWLHHEANYVIRVAERGHPVYSRDQILYVGPDSLYWPIMRHHRVQIVANVQQKPHAQQPDDTKQSQIGVPLLVKDQLIGIVTIDKRESAPFGDTDGQIAQAFVDHVAVAIHNAQLYQQTRTRAYQLRVLHQLSIRLSAMHEVDPLLEELARLLHKTFGYYQVEVGLVTGTVVTVRAACGQINDVAQSGDLQRYTSQRGLTGWAVRHGEIVVSNDVNKDTRYVAHPALPSTRAELVVPIKRGKRVIGIINIESNRAGAFTQDDVRLVEALASQVAIALENIGRYEEIRHAQTELLRGERLRALGTLSSGVAHDFNNLLAGILGHAQLLLQDIQESNAVKDLRIIERAALDGAAIVRRLQAFAQIQQSPPNHSVDINHVIQESLDATWSRWRDTAQGRGIQITVTRNLQQVSAIVGNPPALRELMTNLILNAIDAMPQGGELRVRTSMEKLSNVRPQGKRGMVQQHTDAPVVVIEISDSGIGMSANIQERIFDPFFTTKGERGTGIGLAVAQSVVQRHNGHIFVQSIQGKGSTFTVVFPVIKVREGHTPQTPVVAQPDIANLRVLIVEDETTVQKVLQRIFQRWGCQVATVSSGQEALERFVPAQFDVVCSDLGMPGMSGWDVLASVRQVDPAVATLLITGWGEQINRSDAYKRGADQILGKPFDVEELYTAMQAALTRRSQRMRHHS